MRERLFGLRSGIPTAIHNVPSPVPGTVVRPSLFANRHHDVDIIGVPEATVKNGRDDEVPAGLASGAFRDRIEGKGKFSEAF